MLVGLQYLFLEPNADDPLNKGKLSWHNYFIQDTEIDVKYIYILAAAEDLRANRRAFEQNVRLSMRGGLHKGISYDNVIA